MPHFILDCTANIMKLQDPKQVMDEVYTTALASDLFTPEDIKVRMNPYTHSLVLGGVHDFIHVFAHIMEGRTEEQKAALSKQIVLKLNSLFPEVPIITMNVREFEHSNYYNKNSNQ